MSGRETCKRQFQFIALFFYKTGYPMNGREKRKLGERGEVNPGLGFVLSSILSPN